MKEYIDIVFDKLPGPEGCTFIEVEDETAKSIRLGEWVEREDGFAVIRFPTSRIKDLNTA
jgi:hypothetical protein